MLLCTQDATRLVTLSNQSVFVSLIISFSPRHLVKTAHIKDQPTLLFFFLLKGL